MFDRINKQAAPGLEQSVLLYPSEVQRKMMVHHLIKTCLKLAANLLG